MLTGHLSAIQATAVEAARTTMSYLLILLPLDGNTTPFYPQIKIKGVQIKIKGLQIKITGYQIKIRGHQIKIKGLQIKIRGLQIKIKGIQIKT